MTKKILMGMIFGVLVGSLFNAIGGNALVDQYLFQGLLEFGSRVFMSSLKVMVVPLVFVSLVCGTVSIQDVSKLGRVGVKSLTFYTITTAIAIALALLFASLLNPGEGVALQVSSGFAPKDAPPLIDVLSNIFPTNPFKSLVEGEMLQIIVFALLFGLTLNQLGPKAQKVVDLFQELNEVILKMVMMLIHLAPFGVFCLMSKVFRDQGLSTILPLIKYFMVVVLVLLIHGTIFYSLMLKVFANLSPLQFFKKYKEVLLVAFSTSSSNATIPINLEVVEKKLGVSNSIASFTIPLGATINMDGTAIMQGVATVFVAQVYGVDLSFADYLTVILTATLASIGTAGVPGVGLIMLAMVFKQVNLPVEGIGLIVGVDRLLDMTRTCVNVTGDAIITTIVAKSEGQFDQKIFDDPQSDINA